MRFSNPGLAKRRPRIGRKPAKAKKQRNGEIVTNCDHCKKPLGRTCARDSGSYICACGDGIKGLVAIDSVVRHHEYHYFCCDECRNEFTKGL